MTLPPRRGTRSSRVRSRSNTSPSTPGASHNSLSRSRQSREKRSSHSSPSSTAAPTSPSANRRAPRTSRLRSSSRIDSLNSGDEEHEHSKHNDKDHSDSESEGHGRNGDRSTRGRIQPRRLQQARITEPRGQGRAYYSSTSDDSEPEPNQKRRRRAEVTRSLDKSNSKRIRDSPQSDEDEDEDDNNDDSRTRSHQKTKDDDSDDDGEHEDDDNDNDEDDNNGGRSGLKKPANIKTSKKASHTEKSNLWSKKKSRRTISDDDENSSDEQIKRNPRRRRDFNRESDVDNDDNDNGSSAQGDDSSDGDDDDSSSCKDNTRDSAGIKKPVEVLKPVSKAIASTGNSKSHLKPSPSAEQSPVRSEERSDDEDEGEEDEESWMGDISNKQKGGTERLTSRQRAMQGEEVELEFTKLDSPKSKKKEPTEEFDHDEEVELKKQQKARLRQMIHEKRNKEKRAAMVDRVLRGVTSKRKKTTMASEAHAAQVGTRLTQNEAREGCLRITSSREGMTISLPKDTDDEAMEDLVDNEIWHLRHKMKAKYPRKCKRDPKTGKRIFAEI